MNIIMRAMDLAYEYHYGQVNKHDGEDYMLHVARVAKNVEEAGGGSTEIAVAWLHDILEDTDIDFVYMRNQLKPFEEFPGQAAVICYAVQVISKIRSGETLVEYYNYVKTCPPARFVKVYGDMKDNYGRSVQLPEGKLKTRLCAKYELGFEILAY